MFLQRNTASQVLTLPGTLRLAADGSAVTSGASLTWIKDGTSAAASGTLTHISDGAYTYQPTQGETDAKICGWVLSKTSAVGLAGSVRTTNADPNDGTRLGLTTLPNAAAGANGGLPVLSSSATTLAYTVTTVSTVNAFANNSITAAAIADGAIDRATFATDTGLQSIRSGTCQAGGTTSTVRFDNGASSTNDTYKGLWVYIVSGTGVGQVRLITSYTGATRTANIFPNWTTSTDTSSGYALLPVASMDVYSFLGTMSAGSAGYTGPDWAAIRAPTTAVDLSGTKVKTATDVETDTQDIQSRIPTALVNGRMDANASAISDDSGAADNLEALLDGTGGVTLVASAITLTTPITANTTQISGDGVAADNAESFFDGTGYAGINNVIPTVTTVSNAVTVTGDAATAATRFLTMIELDGGSIYRYTTNSLEQAPTVSSADWTSDEKTVIRAILGIPGSGTTPADPTTGIMDTIRDKVTNLPNDPADASDIAASFTTVNTKLDALPTAASNAAAILAAGDVDGLTLEQTLKICLTALAGKLSGAATTTVTIRSVDDSKDRIVATVDSDGNRTAVILDTTG